jgi:RNA polymerase sigma-70 factor (ECF subfamily)
MNSGSPSETRISLLLRLARSPVLDQAAWREFVEQYGPRIYKWCRGWGLQDADARDVTQQVLLRLARKLADFTYDPQRSFRAWLRTLTHHAWQDLLADRRRPGQSTGNVLDHLSTLEARDDLLHRLEEDYDLELLHIAMTTVEARVEAGTWRAFQLTAIDQVPAVEAAGILGKNVASVYVARSKVQRLLREEIARLRDGRDG